MDFFVSIKLVLLKIFYVIVLVSSKWAIFFFPWNWSPTIFVLSWDSVSGMLFKKKNG